MHGGSLAGRPWRQWRSVCGRSESTEALNVDCSPATNIDHAMAIIHREQCQAPAVEQTNSLPVEAVRGCFGQF